VTQSPISSVTLTTNYKTQEPPCKTLVVDSTALPTLKELKSSGSDEPPPPPPEPPVPAIVNFSVLKVLSENDKDVGLILKMKRR
jgi:hypothetical protein